MHWKVKGLVQKSLSCVPGGVRLNSCLQQWAGGLRNVETNIAIKLGNWTRTMEYLHDVNFDLRGARLVEIGTGWYPTLPFCFSLAGAQSVANVRHRPAARWQFDFALGGSIGRATGNNSFRQRRGPRRGSWAIPQVEAGA